MRVVFVGQHRSAWKRVALHLLTLGIARRTWLHRVNKELDGHEALGLRHGRNAFLLCLPVGGPTWVTLQTARRARTMLEGSGLRHGPGWLLWLATLVPILGNAFFIAWTQSRLNRFWAAERSRSGHGVEIDIDLGKDPTFLVELGAALQESSHAGSRFDARKQARRARWQARRERRQAVRDERAAVRAAGGSTPLLPWLAPARPAPRLLHVTCGRCRTAFDVRQDPAAETALVCPSCQLREVLPSLRGDTLAGNEPAAVAVLRAACPSCGTRFATPRAAQGATTLRCPSCGRSERLGDGAGPAGPPAKPAARRAVRGGRAA